jgi:hypothetical protein
VVEKDVEAMILLVQLREEAVFVEAVLSEVLSAPRPPSQIGDPLLQDG